MTTLTLRHIDDTPNSTVSELMLEGERMCYVIEDGYRANKVSGETRIPAGTYELFKRKSGGFYNRYKARFGHSFVIGLKDVPGFTFILLHIGNSVSNTRGCLLTNTEYYLGSDGNYWGAASTDAYLLVHERINALFAKGKVSIRIDRGGSIAPKNEPDVVDKDEPEIDEPASPGCAVETMSTATLIMFLIFLTISMLT